MGWFSRRENRKTSSVGSAPALRLERLDDRIVPTVQYFGGNVLPHVEAQAVYFGSGWSTPIGGQPAPATIDAALTDLTGGAYMDALTQAGYRVGRGTASAGVVDPIPLPAGGTISDASIQARLKSDISSGLVQSPDANRLYVVYVAPNVAVDLGSGQGTTRQGILGYHGAFGYNGHTIRYAVVAYPGQAVGNSSLGTSATDQLTAVASHELSEAVTDPDVNYSQLGWYDQQRGEIGDITESNPNALVRLDGYLVQLASDTNDHLLRLSPLVAQPPTPPVSPPPPSFSQPTTTSLLTGSAVRLSPWETYVSLTFAVDPGTGSAQPGGVIDLEYNGTLIARGVVHWVNGREQVTFSLIVTGHGMFAVSAHYGPTTGFEPSDSPPVDIDV